MSAGDLDRIVDDLLDAYENATTMAPITDAWSDFDSPAAYAVLDRIAKRRLRDGWEVVGRKIGFTNRTIWELYGVDRPMWAHMWNRTVFTAVDNQAALSIASFVAPRIEPEVVFKLRRPVPVTDDPIAVLECVEWMAPGFEIVQCPFPEWRFKVPDCTAAFGLHGNLVVGTAVAIDDANREAIAAALPTFEAVLSRDGAVIERGIGANVLDSPALALAYLARVMSGQPEYAPPGAGELVTTGTITNAFPIAPGERWVSDYGALGLDGLTVTFS